MSQDLVTQQNNQQVASPFGSRQLGANVNQGAVAIEQERAIAEAQGQLVLAKKFPRDLNSAHAELMKACKSKAFALTAFYTVPNRGSGPSIRFAEEVARVYGNFQYGHRELSRSTGRSEVEVYAWDMENNNRSTRQLTVEHVTDTKNGPKKLTDQADIDNKIANVASKQMRGRILALLPKWLIADAIDEAKKTLAGNNDEPLDVRVRRMTQAFAKYGVTTDHLERYLGHKLDEVLADELVDMIGIFNAIKEGAKPSEYFGAAEAEAEAAGTATSVKQLADANATKKTATKPAAQNKLVKDAAAAAEAKQTAAPAQAEQNSNSAEKDSSVVTEAAPESSDTGGAAAPIDSPDSTDETEGDVF